MAVQGYKKRDIQRAKEKPGVSVSSKTLSASETTETIEFGYPLEKLTVVTTGTLAANVTPKLGDANANTVIAASGIVTTTVTSHMFASVEVVRTAGTGTVIVLAK